MTIAHAVRGLRLLLVGTLLGVGCGSTPEETTDTAAASPVKARLN